ncbi:hypothetical protein H4W33_000985 [Kibdelosporangium phytohabitans]|nr:hypothetical protein [Kibdelosporangium phytohabitans]
MSRQTRPTTVVSQPEIGCPARLGTGQSQPGFLDGVVRVGQ